METTSKSGMDQSVGCLLGSSGASGIGRTESRWPVAEFVCGCGHGVAWVWVPPRCSFWWVQESDGTVKLSTLKPLSIGASLSSWSFYCCCYEFLQVECFYHCYKFLDDRAQGSKTIRVTVGGWPALL